MAYAPLSGMRSATLTTTLAKLMAGEEKAIVKIVRAEILSHLDQCGVMSDRNRLEK